MTLPTAEWHEIAPLLTPEIVAVFVERIERREWLHCWEWLGGRSSRDYGVFYLGGRQMSATRIAYGLARGSVPYGMEICHHCDFPPCCNPTHLFPATHAENMRDASVKGRMGGASRGRMSIEKIRENAEKRSQRRAAKQNPAVA